MPNYNNSPFKAFLKLLTAGVAEWLRGSWQQDKSPTQMYVTSVAIASNVATVGVIVYGGDAPAVGSLLSIQGTQTNSGAFNATNVAITAVSGTVATTGVGTVSFALAHADVATTVDAGMALAPQPITYEAIANGASVAVAAPNNSAGGDLNGKVSCEVIFGTTPTACTVVLQGANFDRDDAYVTLGTVCTVASSAVTANGLTVDTNFLFYRSLTSGLSGAGTYAVPIEA